jgi:hypothetical protein
LYNSLFHKKNHLSFDGFTLSVAEEVRVKLVLSFQRRLESRRGKGAVTPLPLRGAEVND